MKRITIIILFLCVVTVVNAQNPLDLIERYSIDTASMVSYIKENKLKNKGIGVDDNIKIFFCFHFEDTIIHGKEDYLDGSFLNSLYLVWRDEDFRKQDDTSSLTESQRQKLVPDIGWYSVVDKKGVMLGVSSDFYQCLCSVPYRENLVFVYSDPTRFMYEGKIDILFKIGKRTSAYYNYMFGINLSENKIYIIVTTRWGAKMFPLEEIVNNHWEDFQCGLQNLYNEVKERKEYEYSLNPEQL